MLRGMSQPDKPDSGVVPLRPVPRWVAPVFAVLGAAMIPWTLYLAMSLPQHSRTHNYRLAWVGFDVMLLVALLVTAYFAWRGGPLVGLAAACTATILVVDAWFDVTTSRRTDVLTAVFAAVLVELPLAIVCGWIALHVDQVVERRLRRLARRASLLGGTATGIARVGATPSGATETGAHAVERIVKEPEEPR
jgi:hypothetical protein